MPLTSKEKEEMIDDLRGISFDELSQMTIRTKIENINLLNELGNMKEQLIEGLDFYKIHEEIWNLWKDWGFEFDYEIKIV